VQRLRERFPVTPRRFEQIAWVALAMLTLIVFTGAAVRLTGSGLGCHSWPKCTDDQLYAPLNTHSFIEFGNRLLSGLVTISSLVVAAAAFLRRPFRRDLMLLAGLLPLGVLGQAVMGGLTVLYDLSPGWVMAHFGLSMLVLIASVALVWRARRSPEELGRPTVAAGPGGRWTVHAVRSLVPLGGLAIFAGTATTAAGPHAGGAGTGDEVVRFTFKGAETLNFLVHLHAVAVTLLGFAALGAFWLAWRRGAGRGMLEPLGVVCILLASQGFVGSAQWEFHLPAEIVWFHVVAATGTWTAILWAAMAAGRLAPAPAPAEPPWPPEPASEREPAAV
jgi:cytochrome c oxidase assembly protein subunit 15